MAIVEELFDSFVKKAKTLHWSGVRGDVELTQVKPDSGTDLARGPWVKFTFKDGDKDRSIQGYFLYTGDERVKLDGNVEVEDDDVSIEIHDNNLLVSFSGRRTVGSKIFPFLYLFSAKLTS